MAEAEMVPSFDSVHLSNEDEDDDTLTLSEDPMFHQITQEREGMIPPQQLTLELIGYDITEDIQGLLADGMMKFRKLSTKWDQLSRTPN